MQVKTSEMPNNFADGKCLNRILYYCLYLTILYEGPIKEKLAIIAV